MGERKNEMKAENRLLYCAPRRRGAGAEGHADSDRKSVKKIWASVGARRNLFGAGARTKRRRFGGKRSGKDDTTELPWWSGGAVGGPGGGGPGRSSAGREGRWEGGGGRGGMCLGLGDGER